MNINNTMNQYKALSLILLMMAYKVSAESIVYITDEVDIPIRTNKSTKSEIIRLMPTGSELSILQSTEDGWTQIKMGDSFGWILTAFVSSRPPARDQLIKLTRTYNANKLLISKLASEKEILENSEFSISEICYKVGFSSPSYFTKCFKLQYGVLPKEVREDKTN